MPTSGGPRTTPSTAPATWRERSAASRRQRRTVKVASTIASVHRIARHRVAGSIGMPCGRPESTWLLTAAPDTIAEACCIGAAIVTTAAVVSGMAECERRWPMVCMPSRPAVTARRISSSGVDRLIRIAVTSRPVASSPPMLPPGV